MITICLVCLGIKKKKKKKSVNEDLSLLIKIFPANQHSAPLINTFKNASNECTKSV